MPLSSRARAWLSLGLLLALLGMIVAGVFLSPVHEFLTSPEALRDAVRSLGWVAPAVIIGLHILQIVVAPIPGQAIDLANGYLFGWWGILISLIGISLGSTLAIFLARQFGRPLVEVLVTPKGLATVKPYMGRRNQLLFFILFLLPGTPDDLLCFAIGLSRIPFGRSIVIALGGRAPGVVAAVLISATGRHLALWEFTLIAAAVSLLVGFVIWKTPVGKRLHLPRG